ncbi:MAG: hypothetical protein VKM01_02225 [Cyanobacteriota bacterium]|nr:hypothetical protein [Cyanobacteriota bacterium]
MWAFCGERVVAALLVVTAALGAPRSLVAAPLPARDGVLAACGEAQAAGRTDRLQALQVQLTALHPAPAPPAELEADAAALIACGAPSAARRVLARHSPAPGPRRQRWLMLDWQAASLALDHRAAAEALLALAAGEPWRLQDLQLPPPPGPAGPAGPLALDALATHLEALGRRRQAAELLLAGGGEGERRASRLRQVARLRDDLPLAERQRLLEQALDLAAAAGAWGLASDLLNDQALLPVSGARGRQLRLSRGIDDAYGEWQLRRQDAPDAPRTRQLERQLRSPTDASSHDRPPPR